MPGTGGTLVFSCAFPRSDPLASALHWDSLGVFRGVLLSSPGSAGPFFSSTFKQALQTRFAVTMLFLFNYEIVSVAPAASSMSS